METEVTERGRSEVLGMKVISISEGLELGQVKQVVITAEQIVAGFLVSRRRGREERLLPLKAVTSFGEDRITVERQNALERSNSFAREGRRRGPLSLVGSRVFTAGGRILGKVEEYYFSAGDGRLTALEISGGPMQERMRLPGRFIIAISPQTVMIKDEALREAKPVDGTLRAGLSAAVDTVSGAVNTLADSTRQGAKKLTAGLARLWEKGAEEDRPGNSGSREQSATDEGGAHIPEETGTAAVRQPPGDEKVSEMREVVETVSGNGKDGAQPSQGAQTIENS